MPNLKVMSSNAVLRYRGHEADPQKAGKELRVDAVLTGRIVQRGNVLSVSAELVNVGDNSQIWGEQYNENMADLSAVQQEVVRDISDKLRLRLSTEEKERLARRPTESPEAYELYLRGRLEMYKWTEAGWRKSAEDFQKAIDKDPGYAAAFAGLADAYSLLGDGGYLPYTDAFPKAGAAATHAIALNDTLAEAHLALALVQWEEWKFADAAHEFRRAIELNQNLSIAHQRYGWYLTCMGKFSEGLNEERRALELDPLSLHTNSRVGSILTAQREYDKAIEQFRKTLEIDPNYAEARYGLSYTYELKGMHDQAAAELAKGWTANGYPEVGEQVMQEYSTSGWKGVLLGRIKRNNNPADPKSYDPFTVAQTYAELGEKDNAFLWMEKAYDARGPIGDILIDPGLDNLRSDPRYADLLRRMGLPQ